MQIREKRLKKVLLFSALALLYFLFPTSNSGVDAYAYASYVRYNHYLFTPHHLLVNVPVYILYEILGLKHIGYDALLLGKHLNSLFLIGSLWVLYRILSLIEIQFSTKLLLIALVGTSFNAWRYGTEYETYIFPIFFSLLGSYHAFQFEKRMEKTDVFFAGLYAALACLFHQLHFFWWVGLLLYFLLKTTNTKTVLLYLISALLIPISYYLVFVFYYDNEFSFNGILHFAFRVYSDGNTSYDFGIKGFLIHVVNTLRTFVQAHGNMVLLIKSNPFIYLVIIIICITLFVLMLIRLFQKKVLKKRTKLPYKFPARIHFGILLANYLFAFISYGNVEFMVMIPFLLALCIVIFYQLDKKFLVMIVSVFFIWNLSFAILPNRLLDYYNDEKLVDYIIKNQEATYIVANQETRKEYIYKTGDHLCKNIILYSSISQQKLDSLIKHQKNVYTDAVNKPNVLSRKILVEEPNGIDFSLYEKNQLFSYEGFYGETLLFSLNK